MPILDLFQRVSGTYAAAAETLIETASAIQVSEVVDLCSGNGSMMRGILRKAKAQKIKLPKIVLSDLFPDIANYERIQAELGSDTVDFIRAPVNALSPPNSVNFYTLCTALHHFKPRQVRGLFDAIIERGGSILIFEPFGRSWFNVALYLIGLPFLLVTAFLDLLFSKDRVRGPVKGVLYFPLVFPLVYLDGLVSIFRCYTHSELESLLPELPPEYKTSFKGYKTYSPMRSYSFSLQKQ